MEMDTSSIEYLLLLSVFRLILGFSYVGRVLALGVCCLTRLTRPLPCLRFVYQLCRCIYLTSVTTLRTAAGWPTCRAPRVFMCGGLVPMCRSVYVSVWGPVCYPCQRVVAITGCLPGHQQQHDQECQYSRTESLFCPTLLRPAARGGARGAVQSRAQRHGAFGWP